MRRGCILKRGCCQTFLDGGKQLLLQSLDTLGCQAVVNLASWRNIEQTLFFRSILPDDDDLLLAAPRSSDAPPRPRRTPSPDETGAAREVMNALETWATNQGATTVALQVVENNAAARALYKNRRYHLAGSYHYRWRDV